LARLLVDTHVVLWHVLDDSRLGPAPTALLEAEDSEVLVSIASLWEIAIKKALGRLRAPDDLPTRLPDLGFGLLAIEAEHAWAVRELPRHHGDPFDRLLIAQAQTERLPILTADPAFGGYDVTVISDRP
jgi:PIN domain nuclease of toxin-antitoxin system